MKYFDIQSLIENHNYIPTVEFNGMTATKGRQVLEVVEAVRVPADWRDNPEIIGKATLRGKRGVEYSGHVMSYDGRIAIAMAS